MPLQYQPVELATAIKQSRELLPHAVDALCQLITEVTDIAPRRDQVEYISQFWLMQLCDRVVFQQSHTSVEMWKPGTSTKDEVSSQRSRILETISSQGASVMVVDPYLKISFVEELQAVMRSRQQLRWSQSSLRGYVVDTTIKRARLVSNEPTHPTAGPVRVLQQAIAMNAPVDLVEQFHSRSAWATTIVNPSVRVMYTANAHQSSASFRYLAYAQRQVGTKIAIHQHGGGYGVDQQHVGEDHDIAISDVFYTFGWQRPDLGARVRPLPTAMPQRAKKSTPQGYLLMSLPVTEHVYRLQSFLMPAHINRAVEETVSFANELRAGTALCVRSSEPDVFPMARLAGTPANLSHDPGSAQGSVAASRATLTIHNYLGTSWLETLAMNIPTVCFYDPQLYRPRTVVEPFFESLQRVGILHYSGKEAAKFVNSLNGDPSSWWKSAEVQEAREAFVARYANFSANWVEAWQTEFESLLAR